MLRCSASRGCREMARPSSGLQHHEARCRPAMCLSEPADTIRKSAEILRRGMIEVYPRLRDVKVEYVWGGTLDFAFDIMPHAGQIDGIYFAVGYAGHGVAMATWQGQKMAEMIAGEKP